MHDIVKLGAYKTELEELESQLDVLLDEETKRQGKALSARATAADQQEQKQRTLQHDDQKQRTSRNDGSVSLSSSSSSIGIPSLAIKDIPSVAGSTGPAVCNKCLCIPTNHKCRKCKKVPYVCDVCCLTKPDLELAWWCKACFAKETPAAQALICSGNYNSG